MNLSSFMDKPCDMTVVWAELYIEMVTARQVMIG